MSLHAGHCTACDTPIWRTAAHGRTGERVPLYPRPDSVYAIVEASPTDRSPGVGYCAACTPTVGARGPDVRGKATTVFKVVPAGVRYGTWYTPAWGDHLAAWIADYLELSEPEQAAVLEQWRQDCGAVAVGRG